MAATHTSPCAILGAKHHYGHIPYATRVEEFLTNCTQLVYPGVPREILNALHVQGSGLYYALDGAAKWNVLNWVAEHHHEAEGTAAREIVNDAARLADSLFDLSTVAPFRCYLNDVLETHLITKCKEERPLRDKRQSVQLQVEFLGALLPGLAEPRKHG
jgi:hypothetical protein